MRAKKLRRMAGYRAGLRSRTYATALLNRPTAPHRTLEVRAADGTRLRVYAYGPEDAKPVVLIHGWTCAIEYWNAQINTFAGEYRVIAYDQRGHGGSELGRGKLTMDVLADDLVAVLDAALAPGERAVLVGHSLGGMTVQAWAARYPERVREQARAVLLTNTASGRLVAETTVLPWFNRTARFLRRKLALPLVVGRLGLGLPILFPPVAPIRWLFARGIMHPGSTRELLDYSMGVVRSCPSLVRAKFGLLLAEMDLGDAARHLSVPTTLLAGEFDHLTPRVHADRIAELLRESGNLERQAVLPTGHLGNVEAYPQFNEELARVLVGARDERIPAAG
ncbi:alpha/beta fold hydrolase [Nocardia asteroides]|uniref:alpha/beta fold hydrolase n=1 Tax=Nocardia asteroides TaxID=1824 RepID=UPI001E3C2EDD|nr:alpha/beta hydrolase [Nocardia asteroides]UGT64685.1 alpha/beta hydrolase [Nocardia asteroides]